MRNQLLFIASCVFLVSMGLMPTAFGQKRKQTTSEPPLVQSQEVELEMQRKLIDGMKAYFIEDYKTASASV